MRKVSKPKATYNKNSKMSLEARKWQNYFFEGTVVAIDPSIGSRSSMPAIAVWHDGYLVNCERIELNPNQAYYTRLRDLSKQLKAVVEEVDVVIIENIPPFMVSRGTSFKNGGVVHLHQAVGAILGTWDSKGVIEVTPMSWHAFVNRQVGESAYVKTDEHDAIAILMTAMESSGIDVSLPDYQYIFQELKHRS